MLSFSLCCDFFVRYVLMLAKVRKIFEIGVKFFVFLFGGLEFYA